jgi:hypothetical protein
MFDEQDRAYFAHRAAAERTLAAQATDPGIRQIHTEMAEEYQRRSQGEEPRTLFRRNSE